MRRRPKILALLLASGLCAGGLADTIHVHSAAELQMAAKLAADSQATEPLVIDIADGDFELHDTFRILRSNVEIRGSGKSTLRLAGGINKPVVAIGNQEQIPPEAARVRNIRIRNLTIDGNRNAQTSEVGDTQPWIRNNGIDVRRTTDLVVENVRCFRNRSGGLVISWGSRDVTVRDSLFADNFFDGVAYYDSRAVKTTGCEMRDNRGAGISLDNDFTDSEFVNCRLAKNHDVGIFMRCSERVRFERCEIANSGNWGAFLAHDDAGRGVHDIVLDRCVFTGNKGGVRMASVSEAQSSRVSVEDCEFDHTGTADRANVDTAGVPVRVKQ